MGNPGGVGRDEHGRHDLSALTHTCGELVLREVFARPGDVREEVGGAEVSVRAAQIVPTKGTNPARRKVITCVAAFTTRGRRRRRSNSALPPLARRRPGR